LIDETTQGKSATFEANLPNPEPLLAVPLLNCLIIWKSSCARDIWV